MFILEAAPSLNLHSDFSFSNIKPDIISKEIEVSDKINFLLCESCFWCASQSNNCNTSDMITECPSCNATRVESLPISHNEVYKFDYDPKRGVTLEFSNPKP